MSSTSPLQAQTQMQVQGLNSLHGIVISLAYSEDGTMTIRAKMFATEDLVLQDDLIITLTAPIDFLATGGIRLFIDNADAVPQSLSSIIQADEVLLPYLAGSKYDFSVWFYSLRQHLLTQHQPWRTPIPLRRNFPLPSAANIAVQSVRIDVGLGRVQGARAYMEDIDVHFDWIQIGRKRVKLVAIFDGHGGKDCATFVSEELPVKLSALLKTHASYAEAIHRSFVDIDREYLSSASTTAGCTATVLVWIDDDSIGYIANVGDSRAVLNRGGLAIDMTVDHKASDAECIASVASSGGFVSNNRINGLLAVGRAFGDSVLKMPRNKTDVLRVTPDVITYIPDASDSFIIIASDGLWDVMTSQEAVDRVKSGLMSRQIDNEALGKDDLRRHLNALATDIVNTAFKDLGSKDNISMAIITLDRSESKPLSVSITDPICKSISAKDDSLVARSASRRSSTKETPATSIDDLLREVTSLVSPARTATVTRSSLTSMPTPYAPTGLGTSGDKRDKDDDMLDFLMDDNNF